MVANHPVIIKQVFITGASGVLGSALVEELLSHDIKPTVMTRNPSVMTNRDQLQVLKGDLQNLEFAKTAISESDVVFHAAARTPAKNIPDSEYQSINVDGTANIVEECKRARVRLIYVSSINVELFRTGRVSDPYSESKSRAEHIVQNAIDEGLDAVIIRPGYIFGNVVNRAGPLVNRVLSKRLNALPASDRKFCPVFSGDVAKAMWLTAQIPVSGTTFTVAGECTDLMTFVTRVTTAIGRKPPRISLPIWLAAIPLSMLWLLRPLTRWTPPVTMSALKTQAIFEGSTAANELGFTYRSIEEIFSPASLIEGTGK
jgi:nucleoside-diphosphate-sugar epimerase